MRTLLLCSLLTIPVAAIAQNDGGMNEAQMEQMMQQMQGVQDCMANIDPAQLQAFQQQSEQMDGEVKALCAAGKRDAAMAKVMAFGKQAANSQVVQQMQKCGEGMKNMMPKLPQTAQPHDDTSKPQHVCDQYSGR